REDLVQVAREALVVALNRFDPLRRKPFPPYARLTIDGTLRRFLRDQAYMIRPTRRIYELTPRLQAMTEILTQELGRAPTVPEIADAMSVDCADVREAMRARRMESPDSLDRSIDDNGSTLADLAGGVDPNIALVVDRHALRQLVKDMSDDDRQILDE